MSVNFAGVKEQRTNAQKQIAVRPNIDSLKALTPKLTVHALAVLTAFFAGLACVADAAPPRISEDRDLKELDLTGWDCLNKPEGSARTPDGQERNRLKSRSPTDVTGLKLPDLTVAAFIESMSQIDAATVHTRRKDLGPAQRAQIDPLEKDIVQVTGYLGLAYCGPPETTNCADIDFHDWHLEVFEKPPDHPPQIGDTTPIICEITPRTQNAIFKDKIRIQELTAFFRRADLTYEATGHPARKIRLIGYRMWDDEHNGAADVGTTIRRKTPNGYHNPWRQTAWEIHPVIKIVPLEAPMPPTAPQPTPSASTPASSGGTTVAPAGTLAPAPTVSSNPTVTSISTPAEVTKASPPSPQFITLTAPVMIQIPYGQTTLPPGTKLPFISRNAGSVVVQYLGERYPIPIASTDLR